MGVRENFTQNEIRRTRRRTCGTSGACERQRLHQQASRCEFRRAHLQKNSLNRRNAQEKRSTCSIPTISHLLVRYREAVALRMRAQKRRRARARGAHARARTLIWVAWHQATEMWPHSHRRLRSELVNPPTTDPLFVVCTLLFRVEVLGGQLLASLRLGHFASHCTFTHKSLLTLASACVH